MYRKILQCLSTRSVVSNGIGSYCKRKMSSKPPMDLEVQRIVWIDMEMTGLDVETDKILEVACLVTDSDLNIVAEAPEIVLNQPDSILDTMSDWCIKVHGKSGLTEASRSSSMQLEQAEQALLDFLSSHVTERTSPLAGNSVYMDRIFLLKYMPRVHEYLQYRIIDVSSIKELCRRWNNPLYKTAPEKLFCHRALADIHESVAELKFYKDNFFKLNCIGHS